MKLRQVMIIVGTLSLLTVSSVAAWGGNPPGNNGTVKVGGVLDDAAGNDSHVGCEFQVEFYGYDEGPLDATATIALRPPTLPSAGDGVVADDSIFIGGDPAGGANDLDATLSEDLTDQLAAAGAVPTEQGFHVKLTVHAEGSQGADTKHKTFWVSGCGGGEGEGEGDGGGESGGE